MTPSIFLLEDDDVVVDLVREAVAQEGWGFETQRVVDGCLDKIRGGKPSLVLLDLILPDGSGLEVLKGIRSEPALASTPVIILTSKSGVEDRVKGFALGAQDYVAKPFYPQELMARIRAHLAVKGREDSLERRVLEGQVRDRVRQDVVDMVIHDLRTPLSTIRVTLDLIRKFGFVQGAQMDRFVSFAEDSVGFALVMVNDILDLDAGKLVAMPRPLDLPALVARVESMVGLQYRVKKVALRFDVPAGGVPILTDPTILFRVLVNILSNALKFSRSEMEVLARFRAAAGGLRVEVEDHGPGIPDAEKGLVFDKYERTQSAEAQGVPGSGIGLAFCRMACETLGGRIWVEDVPGGGSCFIFEVAALAAADEPAAG